MRVSENYVNRQYTVGKIYNCEFLFGFDFSESLTHCVRYTTPKIEPCVLHTGCDFSSNSKKEKHSNITVASSKATN